MPKLNHTEIRRIAVQFRKYILDGVSSQGKCWIVSAPLVGMLTLKGIQARLVCGYVEFGRHDRRTRTIHWWIRLPGGQILDPTADQFRGDGFRSPAVYLGPKPTSYFPMRGGTMFKDDPLAELGWLFVGEPGVTNA